MPSYQLRAIEPDDYDAAMELWNSAPGVRTSESRKEFVRILARNPGLGCVAVDGGQLVGAVLACSDGRRGYLYHLAVATSHRRQGVGTAMVQRCLAGFAAEGIERCSVHLFVENDEGSRFWKQIGFRDRSDLKVMAIDLR